MHLREVTLHNWRSYAHATYSFPEPVGDRRVVLVGAMNGYGKTSLLMALYLGLFGRAAVKFLESAGFAESETDRGYRLLMNTILHRGSLSEDAPSREHPVARVTLNFSDGDSTKGAERRVVVTRTWHFRRDGSMRDADGDGEELRLEVGDAVEELSSDWQEQNQRIAELVFPDHVMPCFFFDGEQAQRRVEATGGVALQEAVRAIFGTKLLDALEEDLGKFLNQLRNEARRDGGRIGVSDIEQSRQDRDALLELRRRKEERVRELDALTHELDTRLREEQKRQEAVFGGSIADVERIAKDKTLAEAKRDEAKRVVEQSFADVALPLAFSRCRESATQILKAEIARDRWEVTRTTNQNRASEVISIALPPREHDRLDPPLTEAQRAALEKRLLLGLEQLWNPTPKDCASDYTMTFLNTSERESALERLSAVRRGSAQRALDAEEERVRQDEKATQLREQLASATELAPRIRESQERIDRMRNEQSELRAERSELTTALEAGRGRMADLDSSIARLEASRDRVEPIDKRIDVVARTRSAIEETKLDLSDLCKQTLEDETAKHFSAMSAEEHRKVRVRLEGHVEPQLVLGDETTITVSSLSGAQKRALGLAFSLAIAKASGRASPIVIDTPVGNMDSVFRHRVLEYMAKNAPGQLIILSHDEEVTREYAERLERFVIQKFLIEFTPTRDGYGIARPRRGVYFEDAL